MFPPIQPTGIRYFSLTQNEFVSDTVRRLFYISWEDAVWDLIDHVFSGKATILVPDFFCDDVVRNMRSHGNIVHFYPVGKDLQTAPTVFSEYLRRFAPDIVVVFHAVGITNRLIGHYSIWKDSIPKHTVILEDCVHRIIQPNHISLLTDRHVIIDSLRKVMPLQGSFIYGSTRFLTYNAPPIHIGLFYRMKVFIFFLIYQIALLIKHNAVAEWAMIQGYSIIGDHTAGVGGDIVFRKLYRHIHIPRIRAVKKKQVNRYNSELYKVVHENACCFSIPFSDTDKEELRGYPIGIHKGFRSRFVALLRKSNFITRLELAGSPWTKKYGIIYLPLGPHVADQEQTSVIEAVSQTIHQLNK